MTDTSMAPDIGELARELDKQLDAWRTSPLDEVEGLVQCLNGIADKFHIVGGAFGIVNMETNSFDLLRGYPNFPPQHQETLFPYREPPESDLLNAIRRIPEYSIGFDYSTWMHGLFSIQRKSQRIGKIEVTNAAFQVPEYFRHFSGTASPIIATHNQVLNTLQHWVTIWEIASMCQRGLGTTIQQAQKRLLDVKTDKDESTLLACIKNATAIERTPLWARRQIDLLPEIEFFVAESSNAILKTARHLLDQLTPTRVRNILFEENTSGSVSTLDGGRKDATLLTKLRELHWDAKFPIIPYLLLKLVDRRDLHHCVMPLLKTTEFRFRVVPGELIPGGEEIEPNDNTCGMVFLGTVVVEQQIGGLSREITNHLYSLMMLMRLASEPIADKYFYGGIQRRHFQMEGTNEARRASAHQFKDVSFGTGKAWLVTMDRWTQIQTTYSEHPVYKYRLGNALVAPVPELYDAIGRILVLWSLSYKPDDVFPDGLPRNLAELAAQAWNHARSSRLVAVSRNLNFNTSNRALQECWDFKLSREFNYSQLGGRLIETQYFQDNQNGGRIALCESTEDSFKKLSGIFLVLVVAIENYLEHGEESSEMWIEVEEKETLYLVCRNWRRCDGDYNHRPTTHGGFRGIDLIRYLCKTFIGSEAPIVPPPSQGGEYCLQIPIGKPKWLKEHST